MSTQASICLETIRAAIFAHAMCRPDEPVLAAISGGPDSMCLLHALRELGYRVEIAHIDHGTRNGDSALDAAFVRDAAAALGLPFHLETRALEEEASGSPLSFEEFAREVRYDFLRRTAEARGCAVIATGHHADDQSETVLLRLLRGTSPRGLAGIPPVRHEGGVRIVRPLIDCRREQILGYLAERGIAYRTDHSNADPRFARNKVRHELLPLLRREYNPGVDAALNRLSHILQQENDLLNTLAEDFLQRCLSETGQLRRAAFAEGHRALQARALLLLAWRLGADCSYDQVESACRGIVEGATGYTVDLGGGLLLRNGREVAEVVHGPTAVDPGEVALAVPGTTQAFGKRFVIRYRDSAPEGELRRYCSPTRQVFDAEALGDRLSARLRRTGDRFVPFGMTGSKKLKDYFMDLGMPLTERNRQVLLTAHGRIVWIVGYAIDAHVALTPRTRRIVEVEVSDATE